jgi:hypothetical protein
MLTRSQHGSRTTVAMIGKPAQMSFWTAWVKTDLPFQCRNNYTFSHEKV